MRCAGLPLLKDKMSLDLLSASAPTRLGSVRSAALRHPSIPDRFPPLARDCAFVTDPVATAMNLLADLRWGMDNLTRVSLTISAPECLALIKVVEAGIEANVDAALQARKPLLVGSA